MSTEVERFAGADYEVEVRPLKTGGRRDVAVHSTPPPVTSVDEVTPALRRFFADVDDELRKREGDPVALTNGLARLEAILADVRYARATAHDLLADALRANKIRTLSVEGVATVEGTGSIGRSNWNHVGLLRTLIETLGWKVVDRNGEILGVNDVLATLLLCLTPTWKLTGLRDLGIEPDDFCDVERDDRGRPVSTPSVKMVDNRIRRQTALPAGEGAS